MIYCVGDNIVTKLGFTSEENYNALLCDRTALSPQDGTFGIPEPFFASIIDDDIVETRFRSCFPESDAGKYTKFEKMLILSVSQANERTSIDLGSDRVIFIVSTTKGNVSYLSEEEDERIYLWHSANLVSHFFGNHNEPLVVSNACISGAAAQLEALRLIESGAYDYAVVVGGDVLSKFIVSGFQSFKALSPEICRPFNKNHSGLNLGEAAATIIYSSEYEEGGDCVTALKAASLRNDARHISAPSKEAEGLYNALSALLQGVDTEEIAFINAHGTATVYNDEMEALALNRASLQHIPVNSLKAYFGHTLGAAGLLESIISMHALRDGIVLRSRGCFEPDSKREIHPVMEQLSTSKRCFVKMVSGFGGGNAALLFEKLDHSLMEEGRGTPCIGDNENGGYALSIVSHKKLALSGGSAELDSIYRSMGLSYPKFFKMDSLSKCGFLLSELILREAGFDTLTPKKNLSIVLFNRSSSSDDDLLYLQSIKSADDYFPSPSVFVYTLANIVSGEIAIRHKILGETDFYISEHFSETALQRQVEAVMKSRECEYALCGWCECFKGRCEAMLCLVKKDYPPHHGEVIKFNSENIKRLWNS